MTHCWAARWEADGFRSWLEWLIADEQRCRAYAGHMFDDDGLVDPTGGSDLCMLEEGHDSPHEFAPPRQIVVRLPEQRR